jgi:hypothetical protein
VPLPPNAPIGDDKGSTNRSTYNADPAIRLREKYDRSLDHKPESAYKESNPAEWPHNRRSPIDAPSANAANERARDGPQAVPAGEVRGVRSGSTVVLERLNATHCGGDASDTAENQ